METYYNTTNTLPPYIRSNAGLYDRIAETFYTETAKAHTEEEKAQYKLERELKHYKLKITKRGCFDSEKYNKYMAELKQTLADCEEDLQEDIVEGWTDCIEEDKQIIEYYKNIIRIVEELKSNLE